MGSKPYCVECDAELDVVLNCPSCARENGITLPQVASGHVHQATVADDGSISVDGVVIQF
jgi:hypothetical protein